MSKLTAFLLTVVGLSGCRPSSTPSQTQEAEVQELKRQVQQLKEKATTPTPATEPTPAPKPRISEDTRSRILNFIEKASKLSTLTDQGVALTPFTEQLVEVKSAWETLNLVSWPETWNREKADLESAIEGWSLAKGIWERKFKTTSDLNGANFTGAAGKLLQDRLQKYSQTVIRPTKEDSPQQQMDMIFIQVSLTEMELSLHPDKAIRWCMSTASSSFGKARDGIKAKLSE